MGIGRPEDYLELRSDGSFVQEEAGRSFSGTYEIDDDVIILSLPSGVSSIGTINGDILRDPSGGRWLKNTDTEGETNS